jgi:two-component system, NtrC family, sensor kinase
MNATLDNKLADPEQRIADLERQLAEREAELAEAREQQTATAEVLGVINCSPGELAPVFEAILEQATRLCDAAFGVVWTYNRPARRYRPGVMHRAPVVLAEFLSGDYRAGRSDVLNVLGGASFLHILDAAESEGYRKGANLQRRAMVDLGGVRTLLAVPLRRHDTVLAIYRQEVRAFSDKQIALLQNFAAQAVIAMENARLLIETREALEQQTATADVLGVINSSPGDLGPVFDAMLTRAVGLCEADQGVLRTFDGESFPLVAIYGRDPRIVEQVKQLGPIRIFGLLNPVVHGERVVHVPDVRKTATYRGHQIARDRFESTGIRTWLGVALRKEDALLGAIIMFRREVRPFSDKQIALVKNFAAQAVIAMENVRLLEEVRQRQEELHVTFENMVDGVAMFDETQHLAAWNRKFQEILEMPDSLLEQNRTYEEHLRFLAARGDFGPGVSTIEQITEVVASTGQPYGYERTRPDGTVIEIRRNPVPDGGFVLIYSDITERKQNEIEIRAARDAAEEASRTIEAAYRELKTAQANLIQAEKMASLGQLTAGIAHEIKNPLNFVNNFAALSVDLLSELKETAAPGFAVLTDKQRAEIDDISAMLTSNLEKINEHGKRADNIVKAMLEHSRGSSGERRMVDLNMLVDEALNLAYHGARAQDQSFSVTLQRDFGSGIAQIELTPQDITRALLNLFSNGFYATRKRQNNAAEAGFEPTLQVTTCDRGGEVEIRVRDNGVGVPVDIRDRLFQPFFTTKPTGEGTGLGLSISYDIVTQQHGGSITVDSVVGQFSEFTVRLPRNP